MPSDWHYTLQMRKRSSLTALALLPNGVLNVTEYGSINDPEQFKALLAYSPYQHVVNGTKYPVV